MPADFSSHPQAACVLLACLLCPPASCLASTVQGVGDAGCRVACGPASARADCSPVGPGPAMPADLGRKRRVNARWPRRRPGPAWSGGVIEAARAGVIGRRDRGGQARRDRRRDRGPAAAGGGGRQGRTFAGSMSPLGSQRVRESEVAYSARRVFGMLAKTLWPLSKPYGPLSLWPSLEMTRPQQLPGLVAPVVGALN